jgi:hypothetical protein
VEQVTRFAVWLRWQLTGKWTRVERRKARRGPLRSWKYKAWIRTQPSVVSGLMGCEAAHTGSDGGTSMKANDFTCAPLTLEEHLEYHRIGRAAFELLHGLNFGVTVERLNREWRDR